jgi:hypothetical protein
MAVKWSYITDCDRGKRQVSQKSNSKIFLPSEKNHFLALTFVRVGRARRHRTQGKKEGGSCLEVEPSPEIRRSYAAEDAVVLLVDSVLADVVLADPLLSLVLFLSLLSVLLSESFLPVALPSALPLRP